MNLKISALEYVQEVQNGNISAEDFVSKTLEQIQTVDDKLHAFLSVNDKALNQARDIDKKIKSGEQVGACFGMPISIKDNMCIKGVKTTCASKMLENFVAPYDATVISKLMKIDVDDHSEYLEKVQTMISYFDILDSAGVESEEISMPEIPIEQLRNDEYIPFNEKLIEKMNHYKGTYVRAPKM